MSDFNLIAAMDLEIAQIRRRNLLTALSAMSSENCKLKDPSAAIAEFSALLAECDKEIESLKQAVQGQEVA